MQIHYWPVANKNSWGWKSMHWICPSWLLKSCNSFPAVRSHSCLIICMLLLNRKLTVPSLQFILARKQACGWKILQYCNRLNVGLSVYSRSMCFCKTWTYHQSSIFHGSKDEMNREESTTLYITTLGLLKSLTNCILPT